MMEHRYSFQEMADMHLVYGMANCNRAEARRLYAERFPNRALPNEKTFVRLHDRLRETGSFNPVMQNCGRPQTTRTLEMEERVLQIVEENPHVSTREVKVAVGDIDHVSVWRILKSQQLYPYHVQRVQALVPADYPNRNTFCIRVREICVRDPLFISRVLFTDEAGFNRHGIHNYHNNHVWADENPHTILQFRHQQNFSLNVWAGIYGDELFGPVFLPPRLNGNNYLHFLQNELFDYLEDLPVAERQSMWFMHDGAPPHFNVHVRDYLTAQFGNQWIGRGGPVAWPARSPDLNPIDFHLWGHLKSLVYATPVDNVGEMRQRIERGMRQIRDTPGMLERVRESMLRRLRHCVISNSGHFEHLL